MGGISIKSSEGIKRNVKKEWWFYGKETDRRIGGFFFFSKSSNLLKEGGPCVYDVRRNGVIIQTKVSITGLTTARSKQHLLESVLWSSIKLEGTSILAKIFTRRQLSSLCLPFPHISPPPWKSLKQKKKRQKREEMFILQTISSNGDIS